MALSLKVRIFKRSFDLAVSVIGLLTCGWLILVAFLVASFDTRASGFFIQRRIGRSGRGFPLLKIRTMRDVDGSDTTVTTANDHRVTTFGRFFRRTKLDELPQLLNVLFGHMSIVGPRPDVAGFADRLEGPDRVILTVRPGITGPATLRFRDEERVLAAVEDPERYNREVLYPQKVRINREYVEGYRFREDLRIVIATIVEVVRGIRRD